MLLGDQLAIIKVEISFKMMNPAFCYKLGKILKFNGTEITTMVRTNSDKIPVVPYTVFIGIGMDEQFHVFGNLRGGRLFQLSYEECEDLFKTHSKSVLIKPTRPKIKNAKRCVYFTWTILPAAFFQMISADNERECQWHYHTNNAMSLLCKVSRCWRLIWRHLKITRLLIINPHIGIRWGSWSTPFRWIREDALAEVADFPTIEVTLWTSPPGPTFIRPTRPKGSYK
jgi:hypothetical protein